MDIKELHWAAGFMEGEGSFCSHQKRSYVHSTLRCPQKEREPLDRLQKLFGGRITFDSNQGNHGMYLWAANGSLARGIAMTLFPLMSRRRKDQIKQMLTRDTSATWGSAEHKRRISKHAIGT